MYLHTVSIYLVLVARDGSAAALFFLEWVGPDAGECNAIRGCPSKKLN
jgi:hypothetical protein